MKIKASYKHPKNVPHKFDAVHLTQATKVTSGWIKIGVDKGIEMTGSRTRLNIVGVILPDTSESLYSRINNNFQVLIFAS